MIPEINPQLIKPKNNWVLIEPSADIYRVTATGVGGLSIDITWSPWLYPVIYGTVIAVPEKLDYWNFEQAKKYAVDNREVFSDHLQFDVDLDACVGYKVYFNYLSSDNAIKLSRLIQWKGRLFILVRYDLLLAMIISKSNRDYILPLNGWIYYKKVETEKRNKHTESSILYSEEKNILEKGNIHYERQTGIISIAGEVREYFWNSNPIQRDFYKPHNKFLEMESLKIMFDFKSDLKLENDSARANDIAWRRVQEKDIMGWWEGNEFVLNQQRIMVEPCIQKSDGSKLIRLPGSDKPVTEGIVKKVSELKSGTWFDEIEEGMTVKFNVNDPKLMVGVGEEDYLVLKPQNIIYFNQ